MIRFTDMHVAGFLPHFISEHDERDAVTQINEQYAHGGGWVDFNRFTLGAADPVDPSTFTLSFPGDPPMRAVSWAKLRDEWIVLFEHSWVAVIQPDMSMRTARID